MIIQKIPTVLIAYPKDFLCYGKFERKLLNILSNFNQFYIAYMTDDNNFINKHLSSDKRVNDPITSSIDPEHLTKLPPTKVGGLAHSVLMTKVIKLAPS